MRLTSIKIIQDLKPHILQFLSQAHFPLLLFIMKIGRSLKSESLFAEHVEAG
jgi:hypothetical protein